MTSSSTSTPPRVSRVRVGGREFLSQGPHAEWWLRTYCVHTTASWMGQAFQLLPWQRRWLYELLEVDPSTGVRRYRMALLGVPRKGGKTELAAALAAYLAFADGEPSAEVYCAASSEVQADRVFEAVRRMCELGRLGEVAIPPEGKRVTQPAIRAAADPYSSITRLSSVGATKHGLNPHAVIIDELHAWKPAQQDELWDALTTGSAARRQPLILVISMAGDDIEETRLGRLYRLGRAIERGEESAPQFFFRWFEAPEDAPIDDPATWRIANPSLGVIASEDYYRTQLRFNPEHVFRRYLLNQWVDPAVGWLQPADWDALAVDGLELVRGAPTWVGWDASTDRDSTAVVAVQWLDHGGRRRLAVKSRVWARPPSDEGEWRVPRSEVIAYIERLARDYHVRAIAYDPRLITWIAEELESAGYPMLEWPQSDARMASASMRLAELIRDGIIAHDGDHVLRRHLLNARVRPVGESAWRLRKDARRSLIDAAIALAMACGAMAAQGGDRPDTQGRLAIAVADPEDAYAVV